MKYLFLTLFCPIFLMGDSLLLSNVSFVAGDKTRFSCDVALKVSGEADADRIKDLFFLYAESFGDSFEKVEEIDNYPKLFGFFENFNDFLFLRTEDSKVEFITIKNFSFSEPFSKMVKNLYEIRKNGVQSARDFLIHRANVHSLEGEEREQYIENTMKEIYVENNIPPPGYFKLDISMINEHTILIFNLSSGDP